MRARGEGEHRLVSLLEITGVHTYVELILGSHVSFWTRLSCSTLRPCPHGCLSVPPRLPPILPSIGRPVNDRKTTKASKARPHEQHTANISSRLVHTCAHTYTHAAGIRRVKRLEPRSRVPRIFVFAIHSTFALVFARWNDRPRGELGACTSIKWTRRASRVLRFP